MFFDGLSHHHGAPEASPYDDGHHSVVVFLTFAIFFSFVVIYLTVGLIWALAVTALAVALSFGYLSARRRRRADLRRATAVIGVRLASRSSHGGLGHLDPAVSRLLPAFAYKREGGGGDAGAGSGWAQCVICLGLVQVGELVRRLPACNHIFHADCIDMWLRSHSTCPICRAVVAELTVGVPSETEPV
ncbi:RING-H2 finger protein ATL74-like [Lolium perenne]|jgi:E3 ubiquitin-protein ligase ATL41|uniref:RING-H2 finger protein ATL74-like n=1 Tax=Lolium perenne TaxID=4522 RepID=UPI0021EA2C60|nr:E3 ubiquitin-protein ligase EL5-like [Lolium perenne]